MDLDGLGWTWMDLDYEWTWIDLDGLGLTWMDLDGLGWTWMDLDGFIFASIHEMPKYYLVEEFFSQYKLDADLIMKTIYANDVTGFYSLWPEGDFNLCVSAYRNGGSINIPPHIIKSNFIIQSPKNDIGDRIIHFSCNEVMLTKLRGARNYAKKKCSEAKKAGNVVEALRWNAVQLAIKTLMNSQYGVTGSDLSPLFEPDIAAGVTMGGRQCIQFLTKLLESNEFHYIDDIVYSKLDIKDLIEIGMIQCGEVSLEEVRNFIMNDYDGSRVRVNARLWRYVQNIRDNFERTSIPQKAYKIMIKPSKVLYQDTDSNYYKNEYIYNYATENGTKISPEIIDKMMRYMLKHNRAMTVMIEELIGRLPLTTGFEGSFIIERLMPKKKNYCGIQWSPDGDYIPSIKDITPKDNGEYIHIDPDMFNNPYFNIEDIIKKQHVKCTGIDLVRRDKYPFVNYIHATVLIEDMKVMKKDANGNWISCFNPNITDVINMIINRWNDYCREIQHGIKSDKYSFPIIAFAKSCEYNGDTRNAAKSVLLNHIAYMKKKGITLSENDLFKNGDIIRFIVRRPERADIKDQVSDRYMLYEDFIDECNNDEAMMMKLIDVKYYTEALVKSLMGYTVNDEALKQSYNVESFSDEDYKKVVKQYVEEGTKHVMAALFGSPTKNKRKIATIDQNSNKTMLSKNVIDNLASKFKLNNVVRNKMFSGMSLDETRSLIRQLEDYKDYITNEYDHLKSQMTFIQNGMANSCLMFDDIPDDIQNMSPYMIEDKMKHYREEYSALDNWLRMINMQSNCSSLF